MDTFIFVIEILVKGSLGIATLQVYLRINKIWKRKHEKEVAESQSIAGLLLLLFNCLLWIVYYIINQDISSIIDTSIYMVEAFVFLLISTGLWVKGQESKNLWVLMKKAFKLERKEADYLLKRFFKPKNADKIISILHQLAMIDDELDPKEQELIESFAKEWNISYSVEAMNKERASNTENNYMKLRKTVEEYLESEPQREQVAQLRDMVLALINVDDKVTQEEELIESELMGLIAIYLNKDEKVQQYHVLIVPQHPEHEIIIRETFPESRRHQISGGIAYSIGAYFSYKYADMICRERRKINMFTIVHSPTDEDEMVELDSSPITPTPSDD